MQQYIVPTLEDHMKYYWNYDGSKKSTKTEEGDPETNVQPVKKRKTFKQQQHLKAVVIPFLPLGEGKASRARHVQFL